MSGLALALGSLGATAAQSAEAKIAAPSVSVEARTLEWDAVAGASEYQISASDAEGAKRRNAQARTYAETPATAITTAAEPGRTVSYRVRVLLPRRSRWSPWVAISYTRALVMGVNDGSGWGPADASQFIARKITSERLEAPGTQGTAGSIAELLQRSERDGFSNDTVIVGNTPNGEPLSAVRIRAWTAATLEQVREAAGNGATLLEVGNEMFLKGSQCKGCYQQKEPAKYAEMFVSLSKAVHAAEIAGVKLLFDSYGDYQLAKGGAWSKVCCGGGWLRAAVEAEPELRERVSDFTMHPYGPAGSNTRNDVGPRALKVEREQAVSLGFQNTQYYVSEYGVSVGPARNASSLAAQAAGIRATFAELIGFGFVAGVWYYQTHDDFSGHWGLVESQQSDESPFVPRPSLEALAGIASESG